MHQTQWEQRDTNNSTKENNFDRWYTDITYKMDMSGPGYTGSTGMQSIKYR